MLFLVEDKYIGKLIIQYLREKGQYESLLCYLLESGLTELSTDSEELLYIQSLILQGRLEIYIC